MPEGLEGLERLGRSCHLPLRLNSRWLRYAACSVIELIQDFSSSTVQSLSVISSKFEKNGRSANWFGCEAKPGTRWRVKAGILQVSCSSVGAPQK